MNTLRVKFPFSFTGAFAFTFLWWKSYFSRRPLWAGRRSTFLEDDGPRLRIWRFCCSFVRFSSLFVFLLLFICHLFVILLFIRLLFYVVHIKVNVVFYCLFICVIIYSIIHYLLIVTTGDYGY